MSAEFDRRVWSILERRLIEYDSSTQVRPELWPLIRECLALLVAHTPEQIIAGAVGCCLNTNYLMTWIISEGREMELGEENKLEELEDCWNQWEQKAPSFLQRQEQASLYQ